MEGQDSPLPEMWAAIGNIKRICHKGSGGVEEVSGTKHFRAGAKVYVIDAFWGPCHSITVIGQHRKSRRFMCLHMPAKHVENLSLKLVYSPAVRCLMEAHFAKSGYLSVPEKEHAQAILESIPKWQNS